MNRSGEKYLEADGIHGGGRQLDGLKLLLAHGSLLPLLCSGLGGARGAALADTLELLVRHGLDDGLDKGHHVGAEVGGPTILLVTSRMAEEIGAEVAILARAQGQNRLGALRG